MSNHYFNFLADVFVEWFSNRKIAAGNRYQLTLDTQKQVDDLYDALGSMDFQTNVRVAIFDMNADGLNFKAQLLTVNDNQLVIVRNTNEITMDFLVTLRNRIGNQDGIWRGKSIVFISSSVLDSITGGAVDISSEGGPFNSSRLVSKMNDEIHNAKMKPYEVSALERVAAEFDDPQFDFKLMDFADIYGIIKQAKIEHNDFAKLGLFIDDKLASINDAKTQKKRLEKNHELFQKISDIHTMPGVEIAIDDLLPSLANNRKKQLEDDDEWTGSEFEPILQANIKQQDAKKNYAEFSVDDFEAQQNEYVTIWQRPEGSTKAKMRTHNIIIFVHDQDMADTPTFVLPFTSNVHDGDYTKEVNYGGAKGAHVFERKSQGRKTVIAINLPREQSLAATKLTFEQNDIPASKNTFKILVLRASAQNFLSIKSQYMLQVTSSTISINLFEAQDALTFSTGETETIAIENGAQLKDRQFTLDDGYSYNFNDYSFKDDDDSAIVFSLMVGNNSLDIKLATEQNKPVPRSAMSIDIQRRVSDEHIVLNGVQQLSIGNILVYTRKDHQKFLKWEQAILSSATFCIDFSDGELNEIKLDLPEEILEKIHAVQQAVHDAQTLPSLSVVGDNAVSKALTAYYLAVENTINDIEDNSMLEATVQNLAKLGTLRDRDTIYYSPLAPVNVMYFQNAEAQIGTENLSPNVNHRMSASHLVPYIQIGEKLLESSVNDNAPHWIMYNPIKTTGEDSDIAALVANRINDFFDNFNYLFRINQQYTLRVAVKNVTNHKYIIIGAINALIDQITQFVDKAKRGELPTLNNLHPIQLYFAEDTQNAIVDNNLLLREFFRAQTLEQIVNLGASQVKTSVVNQFSNRDIVLALQQNIQVYSKINPEIDYHITFYEFAKQSSPTVTSANKLKMNTTLGGILSSNEYTQMRGWGIGFGTMHNSEVNHDSITRFASKWNALVAATKTENDSFEFGKTIVNFEKKLDDQELATDFENSDWVTFIDPRLDLDAFNTLKNLYVIHYTDKNVTSNVDSITVTKRVDRYNQIIREMLDTQMARYENFPKPTAESQAQIISAFNLLNGVWLLRILNTHQHNRNIVREKLSIISAYKLVIGILNTQNTLWVPISLEELLRITGGSGLSKQNSMLSGEQLSNLRSASDDILMMGAEVDVDGTIKMRILPVEVKVGENTASVLAKAKSQVTSTIHFLNDAVLEAKSFTGRVFRDFFVTLYLNNLSKMESSDVFKSKDYSVLESVKYQLKGEKIVFTNDAGHDFGNGLIVSFKQDAIYRNFEKISTDDGYDITKIEVPESDAYAVPGQSLDTVVKDVKHGAAGFEVSRIPEFVEDNSENKSVWSDLKKKKIEADTIDTSPSDTESILNHSEPVVTELVNKVSEAEVTEPYASNKESDRTESVEDDVGLLDTDIDIDSKMTVTTNSDTSQSNPSTEFKLDSIRLPLGTIAGSSQVVNWEYGNRNLPNRHMLVSGKSGQGKTYFMQGLLLEMKKQNISSLVIDYSDSYRIGQLDSQFIQKMGNKIVNNIVAVNGIALNPFKRVVVDYGDGLVLPEDVGVTAERVAQTLDFVFNLGAQQHSTLVDLIAEGINNYGDNYGFEQLREQLKEDKANTLYGRLQPLLISNVFKKTDKEFNWADFFKNDGTMNIIQLFNIPRRVQNAVTEFLLWDLFHYAQSSGGDESQPLPVFLDEVQNLSFDQDSPAVKILREGRKFGISGIFATQSIASIKGSDKDSVWNAALQMHFLPPEDQVVMLSKSISADKVEREQIEQRLRNLQKGHALLRGPVMGANGLVQQVNEVNILQMDRR